MEFPDASTIDQVISEKPFPSFADVAYAPPTPELDDVRQTARAELGGLPLEDLPEGATIAVGVGSRGIHDIVPVTQAVVDELLVRGYDPVVLPAMGSHGGATPEGQRHTLAGLDLTGENLGVPINTRMETDRLGTSELGHNVWFARSALDTDGVLVINRIKAHTNFTGRVESGLCKMLTVGLGKQAGAQATHECALANGYVETIEAALGVILENAPILGGIGIVENFYDRTAHIEGISAADLPDAETPLLQKAYEYMPTLPYDELDVLVVEQIGKDISGAGMDTNVTGRYQLLNADEPDTPDYKRIVVTGLTEATHGNGQGIGSADLTTVNVAKQLDLDQMYTNALTSGSLSKARTPVVLPSEKHAVTAAVSTIGTYDPDTVRIAWIQDTAHLSSFYVSEAVASEEHDHVEIEDWVSLSFEGGDPVFEPLPAP